MRSNPALLTVFAAWLPLASAVFAAEPPARPNILLLVADDLGWADVGWHGGKFKTPNLDKLAREGVELDRHYAQPVCSPTRTALLSGRWTSRFGPHVLAPTNLRAFPPGTTTLASALKQCGYATFLAGKWHLGSRLEWGPQHYGFDHSVGPLAGAVDPWEHTYRKGEFMKTWQRDGQFVEEQGNATELLAKQAGDWIRAQRVPWFIYVPFLAVHIPIDTPEEYKRLYSDVTFEGDAARTESFRRYGAFVSQLDAKVGQLVAALEETGQRRNTIIIFTSDNGGTPVLANGYAGNTPPLKVAVSSNLPLRGSKNQLYEGGVRVPAFVNWPGVLQPRKVTAPLHVADWMPTLTKLAGWQRPADVKFDGLDIWPVLSGATAEPADRTVYIPHGTGAAVYRGDWKLIARKNPSAQPELFDLGKDPYEKSNLAADQPARVKELQSLLAELRKEDVTKLPADLAQGSAKE